MEFKKFNYKNLEEVMNESKELGLDLHFSENVKVLGRKVKINDRILPNSLAIHPMEGADGEPDGSPGELTKRRYDRFSQGGAGLLWFEAVAVTPEGKANPRQLAINDNNWGNFKELFEDMMSNARKTNGDDFEPLCIMQLTHSGRFSKPEGKFAPILGCHDPYLDEKYGIDENYPIIQDDELVALEDKYVKAAVLAQKAGFHGVDVKCCHRYLASELLSGFTRKGKYGETFEGRTRFLLNIIDKIRERLGDDFIITTRLNVYDAIAYPYGWGVDKEDYNKYDLSEPIKLIKILYQKGVRMINISMGTPYYNPHVNRPFDQGEYIPSEHPLEGIARMTAGIAEIQKAVPEMAVVGTGYSWLRQFSPYLAAGSIENGYATIVGYGRESFAYPDFASDIIKQGELERRRCCIACGKCTEIMRAGGTTGCVIKDQELYVPIYKEFVMGGK